jgi:hypothetical protein
MGGFMLSYGSTKVGSFDVPVPAENDGLAAAFAARGLKVPNLVFTESDVRARKEALRARARERAQSRLAKAAERTLQFDD